MRQPWATALVQGWKPIENRAANWRHRGPLLIHAGREWDLPAVELPEIRAAYARWLLGDLEPPEGWDRFTAEHAVIRPYGAATEAMFPTGAIIGQVTVVGAHLDNGCCRPWGHASLVARARMTHLVLDQPRALSVPEPYRGQLGIWQYPDEDYARLRWLHP